MPIPDYQALMLPLLKITADQKPHKLSEVVERLTVEFNLTPEECSQLLPSGASTLIKSRVGWARSYLKQAGLIEYPQRGFFSITSKGLEILKTNVERIDVKYLTQFLEFRDFLNRTRVREEGAEVDSISMTPLEQIERAYEQLQTSLAEDLLQKVKAASPAFFERLVVDVLLAMGYGGSLKDAARVIGKSGDGGIDGIIKQDKLGLDVIYVQAKRWEATVGRPEIQKFVGALQGVRARKGVFITTSNFSSEARDYVKNLDVKVVLIDGLLLTDLMIENNVAVSVQRRLDIRKMDEDYFTEE